ncbi:tetratricopeptide repeat protein [Sulfitobacter mediterraneus]|uniref:tetratricopeptide repeat protein n=1 Tax=Sulfitobacter mediterraneus TaxID=83219 RepID=UPI00193ADE85|nr:tetratricopeptide repeat protein [Sulfitobacter mediterraneus]MBM1562203.1 tetratricopeptide repeat protein [Sulfitobacter mediterraneus]
MDKNNNEEAITAAAISLRIIREVISLREKANDDHQRLQYEKAIKKLDRALDLLNSINPESEPHASPIKHQILLSRGLNHSALGRAPNALVDIDEAARVLEKTEALDIDPGNLGSKATIAANKANCLIKLERHPEALIEYEKALILFDQVALENSDHAFKEARMVAIANYGALLFQSGRNDEALHWLRQGSSEMKDARLTNGDTSILEHEINSRYNLFQCFLDRGEGEKVREQGSELLKLFDALDPHDRHRLSLEEAKVYNAFAGLLERSGAPYEFVKECYNIALACIGSFSKEHDVLLAAADTVSILCSRGGWLLNKGDFKLALQDFDQALYLLGLATQAGRMPRPEKDAGTLLLNRSHCLFRLGRREEARTSCDTGSQLLSQFAGAGASANLGQAYSLGLLIRVAEVEQSSAKSDVIRRLASLLRLGKHHKKNFELHAWAREKSALLVDMVDLVNRKETDSYLKRLRYWFRVFHLQWWSFAVAREGEDQEAAMAMKDIVLALQGRRIVAELLEEVLSAQAAEVDARVRDFALKRRELRRLLTELQVLEGDPLGRRADGDDGDDDDAWEGGTRRVRGFEGMALAVERGPAPVDRQAEIEAKKEEIRAARKRYEELKAEASKVRGFEILADPVKQITVERLQSGLRAEELLVLVLPHEDPDADETEKVTTSHLWVLGKTGAPRLVHAPAPSEDIPGVADLAALFSRAGASLGAARGGVRKSPDRPGADKPDPLPEAMLGTVWSELERGMRQLIWAPLEASGALEGISQVTVCTMGAFHNLPVASGAPEGLTVRSAGALPIFSLTRGLYAGPGNGAVAPTRPTAAVEAPVALLSDDAASDDIPQTRVEIAASQWLWERARGGAVIRASGVPFAEAEGPVVRLAHTACHGDVDTSVTTPLPVLGLGGGVTERDLVGRPVVEGWMFMSCVVGQNFDDLIEGTPVGLVNGALRNGAGTVVAFISPVPDAIGMLTGLTITAQVSQRGTPLGAAADHARRVLDPTHPEDDPELMRLVAEALASHRVEDFAKQLAGGVTPGELQGDVAEVDRLWTDFAGLAEALAGAASPPSAAELTPLLARHIHPRIPAETPEDQLRLGVLQHALVVFEGYRQG